MNNLVPFVNFTFFLCLTAFQRKDAIFFYFYFTRDVRQPLSQTSLPNSAECFYVPWSWTDHLPRRNKRHRTQSQWPLLLSIEWIYSLHRRYLVERSTLRIIRKLFLSTGCLCFTSSSDAVFLDGRFLLDADRGNLSLLLRCESLQHQHQDVHVSRHLMG